MTPDKLPEPSEIAPGKWGIGDDEIDIRTLIEVAKAMKDVLKRAPFQYEDDGGWSDEVEAVLKKAEEAGL